MAEFGDPCTKCESPLWAPQSIAAGLCAKCGRPVVTSYDEPS